MSIQQRTKDTFFHSDNKCFPIIDVHKIIILRLEIWCSISFKLHLKGVPIENHDTMLQLRSRVRGDFESVYYSSFYYLPCIPACEVCVFRLKANNDIIIIYGVGLVHHDFIPIKILLSISSHSLVIQTYNSATRWT